MDIMVTKVSPAMYDPLNVVDPAVIASNADTAEAIAALDTGLKNYVLEYPILSTTISTTVAVPERFAYIRTVYHTSVAGGGSARYKKVSAEPSHMGKIKTFGNIWWELDEKTITPNMFGAIGVDDAS